MTPHTLHAKWSELFRPVPGPFSAQRLLCFEWIYLKRSQRAHLCRGHVNAFFGDTTTTRVDKHTDYGELKQDSLPTTGGR
jgi:hypothetical protein